MLFFSPLLALLLGLGFSSCQKKSSGKNHQPSGPAVAFGQDGSPPESPSAQPALGPPSSTSALPSGEEADPLGDILSADLTPGETTSRLLSLLPTTPANDQSFLVQIAGNYCPDEEYWRLLPFVIFHRDPRQREKIPGLAENFLVPRGLEQVVVQPVTTGRSQVSVPRLKCAIVTGKQIGRAHV